MSANNQTLIKEYQGKWYVFANVMAESWCDDNMEHVNEISLKAASAICETRDEAFERAWELDKEFGEYGEGTEYGVQFNRLCKDDAEVKIVLAPDQTI